ncbi:nitronate monooxygenase [Thermomonospora cellulosilytica]|uniref:Probable nitronate monooxygenase n=1 Tax=Thermomonospora cellulosilytica TaxID=1411118 RepID=A0A7W3N2E1_9ACTN|nr:nitronate monooxygenase [Thermomonospora cellulosilytica]MBA9006281.1 nitronate monooxygenase [Thermomonospora cellulosilytica]
MGEVRRDLRDLMRHPIIAAPMAGGVGGPALAAAVSRAGGLGFLAGGYQDAARLRAEITEVRAATGTFGVNLFVPGGFAADPAALKAYRERLVPEAERLGVEPGDPEGGDDDWDAKIAALLADPVPVVSFTFGCPSREVIEAFREKGTLVVVTVTTPEEARAVPAADALCVQGSEAGGHRGSFAGEEDLPAYGVRELVTAVRHATDIPLVAAGGLATGADVAEVLARGAIAAQAGTAFLRTPESGAPPAYKAALADARFATTAITRAFTGRPARGLVNRFMSEHGPHAPAAYPHVHHITAPLRRAAARRGDPDVMALWAGKGHRLAAELPAAQVLEGLLPRPQ